MREILFRGRRATKDRAWVYGVPFMNYTAPIAQLDGIEDDDGNLHCVEPETIGQYTGLKDKNGRKIFEGDILKLRFSGPSEVKFADGSFFMEGTAVPFRYADRFEIIGNIHDNPELLKV